MSIKGECGNINIVVDAGACNGCCECLSSCAENNIYMLYSMEAGHPVPFVSEGCLGCGECLKKCEQYSTVVSQQSLCS